MLSFVSAPEGQPGVAGVQSRRTGGRWVRGVPTLPFAVGVTAGIGVAVGGLVVQLAVLLEAFTVGVAIGVWRRPNGAKAGQEV